MKKIQAPPFKLKVTPLSKNKSIQEVMIENNFKSIIEKIIITKEALVNKEA